MKTTGTNAAAVFDSGEARACAFVEFGFDSGTQRYTTLPYTTTWNGYSWIGLGSLVEVSEIRETEQLIATGVRFTLSGVPTSMVSLALAENVQGRQCTVWYAALDTNNQVADTPPIEFRGSVDIPPIAFDASTATIVVNVESRLADFARPNVRRYNDADQQAAYPGDKFFEFVPQMVEKELVWPNRQWFRKFG